MERIVETGLAIAIRDSLVIGGGVKEGEAPWKGSVPVESFRFR